MALDVQQMRVVVRPIRRNCARPALAEPLTPDRTDKMVPGSIGSQFRSVSVPARHKVDHTD